MKKVAETVPKVLTVVNEKGGVGKSAEIASLAWRAGERKLKTMIVDLDSAGGQSVLFKWVAPSTQPVEASSLFAEDFLGGALPRVFDKEIYLVEADEGLLDVESQGMSVDAAGMPIEAGIFKRNLAQLSLGFDLVLIDTPGVLQARVIAAMVAADAMFTPFRYEPQMERSLNRLNKVMSNAKKFNVGLRHLGLVPSMLDCRNPVEVAEIEAMREAFGDMITKAAACRRAHVQRSMLAQRPCWEKARTKSDKHAADEMLAVCDELLDRLFA